MEKKKNCYPKSIEINRQCPMVFSGSIRNRLKIIIGKTFYVNNKMTI